MGIVTTQFLFFLKRMWRFFSHKEITVKYDFSVQKAPHSWIYIESSVSFLDFL